MAPRDPVIVCRQCYSPHVFDCAECVHKICAPCVAKMGGSHGHGNTKILREEAFENSKKFVRGEPPYATFHACGFERMKPSRAPPSTP